MGKEKGSQKILFIDRDGTIISETIDEQIDSFEKLIFLPEVYYYLNKISKQLDYQFVMVTNQDGLGTDSFPEDSFWPVQNYVINSLANEGIEFADIIIDKTFPEENAPTRKPGTALLTKYFDPDYDLENSFVIGDRLTDMELAKNLGSQGIYLNHKTNLGSAEVKTSQKELDHYIALECTGWKEIYEYLVLKDRVAEVSRKTKETEIEIRLNVDGTGNSEISTGISFF